MNNGYQFSVEGKFSKAFFTIPDVEEECVSQVTKCCNHPAFSNTIVLQPDTHAGKGSVIGFTMSLDGIDKIVPNTVGVDIGCGMLSINIGNKLNHSIEEIDNFIHENIPFGFETNKKPVMNIERDIEFNKAVEHIFGSRIDYKSVFGKVDVDCFAASKAIGTCGGGNHFAEIGISLNGDYWLTIHTGSRNLGKKICDHFQRLAENSENVIRIDELKNRIEQIKKTFPASELEKEINKARMELRGSDGIGEKELSYLTGNNRIDYLNYMQFAQIYASFNRKLIADKIVKFILTEGNKVVETVESIHNYIDFKDNVLRKGAIRSYLGEKMIIPLNMRDGMLLCTGKSNKDWNYSAPHGAGRNFSRTKAKELFSLEEYKESMKDVYSSCICTETLDESPMAYKDSEMIKKYISPTAEIIEQIKPVLNIKDKCEKKKR